MGDTTQARPQPEGEFPLVDSAFATQLGHSFGSEIDPEVTLAAPGREKRDSFDADQFGPAQANRYHLEAEVGRGSMGTVFRVWDGQLRRPLAMKVLNPSKPTPAGESTSLEQKRSRNQLARGFLEEAQLTGQLDHPGVIPVHDLGIDKDGVVYFTMRLVRGNNFRSVIELVHAQKDGWTQTRALGVLLRICETMAYAHDRGVMHRDIKPANVMVGEYGEVYVVDWGLACDEARKREQSKGSEYSGIIGTPYYMAPEAAAGQACTLCSDVYSLGATLYTLLAGHAPYADPGLQRDSLQVIDAVQEGPPTPLEQRTHKVAPELIAICEKAMARKPSERYARASEMADDVRAHLEQRVVAAYETGPIAELRKWVRRNRALAATISVTLVSIVISLAAISAIQAKSKRSLAVRNAELLQANATIAEARDEAQAERAVVLRLSDGVRLKALESEAEQLWPAHPARIPQYENWLQRAQVLSGRLDLHRQTLKQLERQAESPLATLRKGEQLQFSSTESAWQYQTLSALVAGLEEFSGADNPTQTADSPVADIRNRLAIASQLAERSTTGAGARWLWAEAQDSISDPDQCPQYAGLKLTPQMGLLPLGRDPRSGLWEFAHLLSGEAPTRDPSTGEIVMRAESGIVLVLIPGGERRIGAESNPEAAHYDPLAAEQEGPVRTLHLEPYFLSKFELTQAQWLRIAGANPSTYQPGRAKLLLEPTLLNPVENVSWIESRRMLRRLGLRLPFEREWESAARAGSDTPWPEGELAPSLEGMANLADRSLLRAGFSGEYEDWLEDGYGAHAPVGSFRPNALGLHDMVGNVAEWCFDGFGSPIQPDSSSVLDGVEAIPAGASTAEAQSNSLVPLARITRGGSWGTSAAFARSSSRYPTPSGAVSNDLGLRPARSIDDP